MENINFQPMPKRFIVWDKGLQKFYSGSEGKAYVFDIWSLIEFLNNSQRYPEQLEIVQSTNLFDKDGEEIFEGSVVDYSDNGCMIGFVRQHEGQWYLEDKYGHLLFLKGAPHQKLIGHILSNPELLEKAWHT